MIETKIVQRFGNSGHIVLPKPYIGKRIRFIAESKTFGDIKSEILEILKPYLENIWGVYLYGSYARNEQTISSDADILVIADTKLRIMDKIGYFHIVSSTSEEIEDILEHNAVLILPIIKEAKTIINPNLLEKYSKQRFTKKNTGQFLASTKKILELNQKGLKLEFEIGSLIYSLMLRIRGLLMIKVSHSNELYSKSLLLDYLRNNNMSKEKIEELYGIYSKERDGVNIKESNLIAKADVKKLLGIAENLLKDVKKSLR